MVAVQLQEFLNEAYENLVCGKGLRQRRIKSNGGFGSTPKVCILVIMGTAAKIKFRNNVRKIHQNGYTEKMMTLLWRRGNLDGMDPSESHLFCECVYRDLIPL